MNSDSLSVPAPVSRSSGAHILTTVLLGAAVFWLSGFVAKALTGPELDWRQHAVLKTVMLVLSLGLIAVLGRGRLADYGLARAKPVRWRWVVGTGLLLGASASVVAMLVPGPGMTFLKGFSFPQLVLGVWLGSSIAEELLTRGFVQGALAPLAERRVTVAGVSVSVPVLVSGFFFGAMHLSLIGKVDAPHVAVIVTFTTLLGLAAGLVRERSGGLFPAIAIHVLFNVGGMLGGILYFVAQRLTR
jgi:membrane protease YdiL (CAAX protease family)